MNIARENIVKHKDELSIPTAARRIVRPRRFRSGTAVIETVFALQILLFLTFGMVEFGQYMYIRHAFVSAARDGCRAAILPTTTTITPVNNAVNNTLLLAGITYNANWIALTQSTTGAVGSFTSVANPNSVSTGNYICVTVSTNYSQIPLALRPLSSITGNTFGIGTSKTVTGSATMVMQ